MKYDADDSGQLTIERTQKSGDLSSPKVGKIDPKNTPHVGGNTWAGGTGGRDTAGLGGRGGPYRLDAGHDVHQVFFIFISVISPIFTPWFIRYLTKIKLQYQKRSREQQEKWGKKHIKSV